MRKKHLDWTALFREIVGHPGRYLAMIAIIGLGVGFFAGLRICRDDMVETGSAYLGRQNLFDVRLICGVGFDGEAVEHLKADPSVEEAEGGYAFDGLFLTEEGSEAVARFFSVPGRVNRPLVTAGRLPEKENECALDCQVFTEDKIGTTFVLSDSNAEDESHFTRTEFTVTGLCFSPLYLNYERGTTSLGTGSVSCFVYLSPDAFDAEAYTEAYVTLTDAPAAFSDGYRDFSDDLMPHIESLLDETAATRLERATADVRQEIADGEQAILDAQAELDKAENEDLPKLRDGIEEAEDGIRQLEEGIAEVEDALASFDSLRESVHNEVLAQIAAALGIPAEMLPADHPAVHAALAEADTELDQQKTAAEETAGELKSKLDETVSLRDELKETLRDAESEIEENRRTLAEKTEELADAKEALAEVESRKNYALDRFTNVGYACFENDAAIVQGISRVFPIFFFLVAALVCATTMTRMITEERTQIGTRKALGYSAAAISRKYLLYAASAAVIGSVGGYLVGTTVIPEIIWKVYEIMYGPIASLSHVKSPLLFGVSFAAAALCSVGTAWITGRAVLSERPAELIRPKAPKAGRRVFLEKIPFLWRRMSFLHKVSARNILRYKNRLWMMILGIGGCTALLLTGAGIRDSISGIVEVQYGRVAHYDYALTVSDPLSGEEREALSEVEAVERILWLHESSVEVRSEKTVKTSILVVPEEIGKAFADMISLEHEGQSVPFPGEGGCTIDVHLAEQLGVKPGDMLTVASGDETAEVRLESLCDNYVNSYIYLTPETYREAFGKDASVRTAYIRAPEGLDPYEGGAMLLDCEDVVNVTVTQAVKDRISNFLRNLYYIVLLVIVCAGLLAFIVLYELTEINITERVREIATVKVLGFYRGETAAYVFRENRVLTLLGALAGMPLGILLHRFVMSQIKVDMVSFIPHISALTYVFALVLTFIFEAVVHLCMRRRIARIPMAESLKSVE
ncbi:MAG: FtsX-like permease family protein [Oscillospiraceae bacterium]|nr:FtsX-like permease family protein [Oscillospiraceae bacterium]